MFSPFWREGPHFAMFVGLTEGEDVQDLRRKTGEMSVLIHSPKDVTVLKPPSAEAFEAWVAEFLGEAADRLGTKVSLLLEKDVRERIAGTLRARFEEIPESERVLRNWTKLAGLPVAVLLANRELVGSEEIVSIVDRAARETGGEMLPWEEETEYV